MQPSLSVCVLAIYTCFKILPFFAFRIIVFVWREFFLLFEFVVCPSAYRSAGFSEKALAVFHTLRFSFTDLFAKFETTKFYLKINNVKNL